MTSQSACYVSQITKTLLKTPLQVFLYIKTTRTQCFHDFMEAANAYRVGK